MRIKARFEQLSLVGEFDEPLQRFYGFSEALENHLANMKYLHKRIEKGNADDAAAFKALRFLRDTQIGVAKLLIILGREYEGRRYDKNFNYYWDGFITDRLKDYGYLPEPHSQYDLYEMLHNQRMRFSGSLIQYKKVWQPFCEDLVKSIEENLKQAQYALK